MRLIKKLRRGAIVQLNDATLVSKPIVTNLPMDDSIESKFYRDLAALSAMTNEERAKEDFYNRAHYTGTIGPTNEEARTGWMEVNPTTGETIWHAPTVKVNNLPGAWQQMAQSAWNSPAFQLAIVPMFDIPFIFKGLNTKVLPNGIIRDVGLNSKIRLSLPSHTATNPRQIVLEPAGAGKYRPHIRIWDGDHVPGVISNSDKQLLYNTMVDLLPNGTELLFPQSGPGYYATRGTVAGLLRLGRDSRFIPGSKGILYYTDKDGTIKTFEGTSFIRLPNYFKTLSDNQISTAPVHYNVDDVTQRLIDYTKLRNYKSVDTDWLKDAAARIMSEGKPKFTHVDFGNFDLALFKENYYPALIDDFVTDTYYHKALTSDDIIREFAKMGRPEEDVFIDKDLLGQFYSKDVFPRTLANLKKQGINLKPEEIEELSHIYKSPWEGVDMKYGYTEPGSAGFSRGPNFIRYEFDRDIPFTNAGHEFHHSTRHRLGEYLNNKGYTISSPSDLSASLLSGKQERFTRQIFLPEYTSSELKAMNKYRFDETMRNYLTPTSEQGASLAELRLKYFKQYLDELKIKNKSFNLAEFDLWLLDTKAKLVLDDLFSQGYGETFGERFDAIIDKAIEHYYKTNTYPKWLPKSKVKSIEALKKVNGYNYFYWRTFLRNAMSEYLGKLILKDVSKIAGLSTPIMIGNKSN